MTSVTLTGRALGAILEMTLPSKYNTIHDVLERLILCEPSSMPTGCWEFGGGKTANGYGWVRMKMAMCYVHRVVYEHFVGPIPGQLQLDHLCRNRACANPEHLEAVTQKVNSLRGNGIGARNAAKTHCKYGHPLSGENLQVYSGHWRRCRACQVLASRRQYERRRLKEAAIKAETARLTG